MKTNKKIPAILMAIIAVVGLAFAIANASALPIINAAGVSATAQSTPVTPIIPIQRSYVRLIGEIDTWGPQNVNGTLTAMTSTTAVSAVPILWLDSVNALWNTTNEYRQDGNISYNFYAARLVKANFTAVDFQGNNFYLNGTWSVFQITITRIVTQTDGSTSIQSSTNITPLETRVYGELNVTDNWSQFTLSITGIDQLNGSLIRSVERQALFNRFDIVNQGTATIVTRADLTTVSNDYGAVPGSPNYDENMDFHGTYQIDICDIATIAANVQQ